jgi:SAM-dependent methyltransferase
LISELDKASVEVASCPVCGGVSFATEFEEPPYRVMRCRGCGLGLVSPRHTQTELAAIYGDDSYWRSPSPSSRGYDDYRRDEPLYLATFRRRLDFFLRDGPDGGRALDVGSAAGFCMQALRERGFDAYGVELSEAMASHARERFGFDTVHVGPLDDAPFEERSFDLITMWDVVEHVVEPLSLLVAARKLLKSDGLLVLETQNVDSAFARALGPRWHHYKHAEHIYHFTPATIRRLLDRAGFHVERLTPRFGGKYVSLDFIAERAARVHSAFSAALRPLTRFGSPSMYFNFMDEMVVTARPAGAAGGVPVAAEPAAMEATANRQFVALEERHFWFVGRRRIFFHLLDRELGGRSDARILDVGCGAGGMLAPLSPYGEVTGIDLSPELVEFCHQRGFDRVEVGSAYELPVDDGSVDLITLFDTIEHVPDDERVLRECRRALVSGGLLFLSVPAYQFLYANNDRVVHHQRRYTARQLRRKLTVAGFTATQVTYFNTLLLPAILPIVLANKVHERFSAPDDTTNLSHGVPRPLNWLLAVMMSSERHVLSRMSLPFGHSIIAIARA